MPPQTLDAVRDHSKVRLSITEDVAGRRRASWRSSPKVGIDFQGRDRTNSSAEGVSSFSKSFDTLMAAGIKAKR